MALLKRHNANSTSQKTNGLRVILSPPEFGTFGEKMLLGHQNLINIEKDKVIFVSAGIFYLNKDGSVEFMVVATAGTSEFSVSTQIILP